MYPAIYYYTNSGSTACDLFVINLEEAKSLGIQELEQELNEEIENKEKIINKNTNIYEEQDGVEVYVTYEVLENIGTNEKIVFWRDEINGREKP